VAFNKTLQEIFHHFVVPPFELIYILSRHASRNRALGAKDEQLAPERIPAHANQHASAGSVSELERIVTRIRERWPRVKIVVRGDGGFANDGLVSWCERNQVDYVLGLARTSRLVERIHLERAWAEEAAERTGQTARRFADFTWRTRTSWSRSRRVVAKAEHMPGHGERGANPRFVVTSLSLEEADARTLYEKRYCARGGRHPGPADPRRPPHRVGRRVHAPALCAGRDHHRRGARLRRCVSVLTTRVHKVPPTSRCRALKPARATTPRVPPVDWLGSTFPTRMQAIRLAQAKPNLQPSRCQRRAGSRPPSGGRDHPKQVVVIIRKARS